MPTLGRAADREDSGTASATRTDAQSWKDGFIYFDKLGKNRADKAALVLSQFPRSVIEAGGAGKLIVDIGCAGGDVLAAIHDELPRARLIGIDVKQKAIEDSRKKVPEGRFHRLDITKSRLPIDTDTADLVNISAVCHELIDYQTQGQKLAIVTRVLKEIRRILKPGGKLFIREPTLPENPSATIILALSRSQKVTASRPQVAEVYSHLTESQLFEKFLDEWIYLDDAPVRALPSTNGAREARYEVPAWIVAEYARKRTFIDQIGNWESEMEELNAAFTPQEMRQCAVEAGFGETTIQMHTLMEEGYYGAFKKGDGVTLTDQCGSPIDQAAVLPSHMYLVIEA